MQLLGKSQPEQFAESLRKAAAWISGAIAAFMILRGALPAALALGGVALVLASGLPLDWRSAVAVIFGARKSGANWLKMSDADGEIIAGPNAGRRLSELTYGECLSFYAQARVGDPIAAATLEAYLDRRFAGWRAAGQRDSDTGDRFAATDGNGEMSQQEAYKTLGLPPGAGADEIIRAHRRLMKERHPDHGGATAEAARINQAKDRLLRRHG